MDGFPVLPIQRAAEVGDLFITVTGDRHVIDRDALAAMKNGAILANSGHFDHEINIDALQEMSVDRRTLRPFVEEYRLDDHRSLFLLAEGRLVNLAAAEGHPPA